VADPFVAEIRIMPFSFAPAGWAWCDGQLMPLAQNLALFSLLGTTYGGDGKSTFALPDMRGAAPVQPGQGPGLSPYALGESGGSDTVTLTTAQLPSHTHTVQARTPDAGDTSVPGRGAALAPSSGAAVYQSTAGADLSDETLSVHGSGSPHNNLQPYLTLAFCIALQGVYPPRE
jgi:microcystin-dependent protein